MKKKKIPKFLQPFLWFYNLNFLDLDNQAQRQLIIQQILNYGDEKAVKWLLKNFSLNEIKKTLKNPSRGFWHPESLTYWLKIFGLKLKRNTYEKAIKNIYPKERVY